MKLENICVGEEGNDRSAIAAENKYGVCCAFSAVVALPFNEEIKLFTDKNIFSFPSSDG